MLTAPAERGSLPASDDDPDPGEPIGPEIVYKERMCPVCGEPVSDKQTYDKDACPQAGRQVTDDLGGLA